MNAIREFVPAREPLDFDRLLLAFLGFWNSPENLRFLSFSQRPFAAELVRARIEQHTPAGVRHWSRVLRRP